MADIKFEGVDDYIDMLQRLGDNYELTLRDMCNAGLDVLASAIKGATGVFAKYVAAIKAKRGRYTWYAQVKFAGETHRNTPVELAARVYTHGRKEGKSKSGRKIPKQEARPFIYSTVEQATPKVIDAMQKVYDEEVAKIASNESQD